MNTFSELAESRRNWISQSLIPWCGAARLRDLQLAEFEWTDIAGKVDPAKTLWFWAWRRFPAIVHEELAGIDESRAVCVTLNDGSCVTGYPDAQRSQQGRLVLLGRSSKPPRLEIEHGPISIDDIREIAPVAG